MRRRKFPSWARDDGWEPPARVRQLDLFPRPRDQTLAYARISIDEIERWRARGWISFDVREEYELQPGRIAEICFIRNLAHSGLSEPQIDELLSELRPPYMYEPHRVAYSFAHGWVQVPIPPDEFRVDEYFEKYLKSWINRKAMTGEHKLLTKYYNEIMRAVVEARTRGVGKERGEGL